MLTIARIEGYRLIHSKADLYVATPRLSGDSVRAYLRDIGRIPLLEHDEEILLGRKVQRLMEIKEQKETLNLDTKGLAEASDISLKAT